MVRLRDWILRRKNDLIDFSLGVSAIMIFVPYFIWIAIVIFIINIFVFKRHLNSSLILLAIASTMYIYPLISNPELEAEMRAVTRSLSDFVIRRIIITLVE